MRWLRPILGLLLCFLIVLLGDNRLGQLPPLVKFLDPFHGFWQNAEFSADEGHREVSNIQGLENEANIIYDERGVPHIFAENDRDLYFLQGYLTASDRLWQMEFQTHAAAGRLSEIIGSKAKTYDMEQRRIGMVWAAERAVEKFQKDELSRNVIEAYTAGINTFIGTLAEKDLPLEYKLLDYGPEPWTVLKSSLLLKYMAKMLTGADHDRENTEALKLLGPEMFELLYPEQNYLPEPVVPNFGADTVSPPNNFQACLPNGSWPDDQKEPHFVGSNNWAVAGNRTASGNPILCNDPHLRLSLPSIWYEIQLNSSEVNCYGVSLPGAPGVILGFNDNIAWGVTNAGRDVRDYYVIEYQDERKNRYKYGPEWLETDKRIEEIKIRGGKTEFDTVVYTRYGPVAYTDTETGKDLALRWTAHDPSNEMLTFYKLNRARKFADFEEALSHYQCPPQNFAYADVDGNIALWQQGKFFKKPKYHGKFVLDGADPAAEVNEFIPQKQNPHMINPERGFVSSANQPASDTSYPYYYTGIFEEFRNRTINDYLRNDSNLTIEEMKQLQLSNYNLLAAEALPVLFSYMDTLDFLEPTQRKALGVLWGWRDFRNDPGLIAPTVFEIWWNDLNNIVWDELNNPAYDQGKYYRYAWESIMKTDRVNIDMRDKRYTYPMAKTLIRLLKEDPENKIFDHYYTKDTIETARDVIRDSYYWACVKMADVIDYNFADPRWGKYKDTRARHLLRIDALGSPLLIAGGSENAPNAQTRTHGPSWRTIIEMTPDGPNAIGVLPGGQSGNPGSRHYMTSLEKWTLGEYDELLFLDRSDLQSGNWDAIRINSKSE